MLETSEDDWRSIPPDILESNQDMVERMNNELPDGTPNLNKINISQSRQDELLCDISYYRH